MLVTTCSHCLSRFRVTPQQLNEKQGQVRCGRCHQVFNGFEALERFPDDDTGARLLAMREAEARGEAPPEPVSVPEEELPEIESVEAAPPMPIETRPAIPHHESAEPQRAAAAEPEDDPIEPAAPPSTAPRAASPGQPASRTSPRIDLMLEPPPRKPVARAWSFGVALMALLVAIEFAFAFRAQIAQRYPPTRGVLEAACAYLRCTVAYSRQDALLKLEESEMLEVPGKPNEIALGARVRNLATIAQEYPYLELTLTDFTGQPAARKVLRPTDYLGRPVRAGEVLLPGAEMAVQLRIETPNIKPTGYELLLFYP